MTTSMAIEPPAAAGGLVATHGIEPYHVAGISATDGVSDPRLAVAGFVGAVRMARSTNPSQSAAGNS